MRLHYFTNRIVNTWNSLPGEIVNAHSVSNFKNMLNKLWLTQNVVYNYIANIAAELLESRPWMYIKVTGECY
jgi:hypothetical protein